MKSVNVALAAAGLLFNAAVVTSSFVGNFYQAQVPLSASKAAFVAEAKGEPAPAQKGDIARLEAQWRTRLPQQQPFPLTSPDIDVSRPRTGHISVHRNTAHGPFLGFLTANKIVQSALEATNYTITIPLSANPPRAAVTHDIDVADSSRFQMCVAVGPLGASLGPALWAFHFARHAERVDVTEGEEGREPRWAPDLNTFVMTSVFALDPESSEITVRWRNPDGEYPQTTIALAHERVFYTGDMSAFRKVVGRRKSTVQVVAFNWVEFHGQMY
ncbi:hypothetical protein C8R46DRAFT_1185067 [Mycena filopes]|nr:hypothetical protein C8R46DRAFT_1185067 [Mycena filopes]